MEQYDRLEMLLIKKAFSNLTEVERSWIEQFMSASEYDDQRETLLSSKILLAKAPTLSSELENTLMQAFSEQHQSRALFSLHLLKPIVSIAAVLAIFLLGRWTVPSPVQVPPQVKTITVNQITKDTIYIEKTKIVAQFKIKEKFIRDTLYINQQQSIPVATNEILEVMPILEITPYSNKSSTVKDQKVIYDILVDVY